MIYDTLLGIAAANPSNGLYEAERFLSYEDAATQVTRLAAGFTERGIGEGDVVALLLPNSPKLFVVAHALFAIGAIAMPLALTATRAELLSLARKTGLAAIVAAPSARAHAEALIAEIAPAAPLFDGNRLESLERAPSPLPKLSGDTPAIYLFSSGSTGLPKVVPHTHAEFIADGIRTSTAWDLTPDDLVLDILPANFAMGFFLGAIDAPSRGASVVYWSDPLPLSLSRKKLLAEIAARRVSFMGAVPAMYEIIVGGGPVDPLPLRLAFSGGAALKRPIFEAVRDRLGITLRQDYGSTEAIMVSHNNAADPDATWASVGPPAPGVEVRLAPVETDLGPGVGELLIRTPSMMQGYLNDPAATASAFEDGWFRSGDLASLDAEGRITIRGRSKLLIEVSGYKIDPLEVEEALAAAPAIAEAAVMGRPDPRAGNRLVAFVVRRGDITADEVLRHARTALSAHKVPTEIAFVDALPRTQEGKLLRGRLGEF
jgi:long-chain acyl-CoA synthetase